jgi:hypothetical protein
MKKFFAITLTIALVLSLATTLAACGNGGEDSNSPFASVRVGDIIQFGQLDWLVLAAEDGKALVLSDKILENRNYHADGGDITWEHSSIRAYLNGEFYNGFSAADQNRIISTNIVNNGNPMFGTAGGNDTTDNIFLLSIDEEQTYFADDSARIALDSDGTAHWWWLRSPGFDSNLAACVDYGGDFSSYGNGVILIIGVRPALWLNLE